MEKQITIKPAKVVGGSEWKAQVAGKLLDGFGVEDIAIWLGCDVRKVRQEVMRLRIMGWLDKWFKKDTGS